MARLRKGLLEIQREQKEMSRIRKKSSGSDSSNSSPSSFSSPRFFFISGLEVPSFIEKGALAGRRPRFV